MAFIIWDFRKNKTIQGELVAKLSNIPPYGKKVYGIKIKDGTQWHVWGSYQVVGHLAMLPFGTVLSLTYRGKGEVTPGKPEQHLYDCKIIELPKGAKMPERWVKKAGRTTPPVKTPPRGKQKAKKA